MQNHDPNKCECTSYEQKKTIYFPHQIHICHAFIFRERFRPIMFIRPLTVATRYLDGVITCNGCNRSTTHGYDGCGAFIRGMLVH